MSLVIDWCSYEAAKHAVENWHYSKRMPTCKLAKLGVWENDQFIGAVVFGVGATSTLVRPYGLTPQEGCELVRVALKSHGAPVSQILAIALAKIKVRYPGLKLIVSFADPDEGHVGSIYQATNWIYSGKTEKCKFPVIDGVKRHPRVVADMLDSGRIKSRSDLQWITMPGKYRYLFPLDKKLRKQLLKLAKPYPKRIEQTTQT